MQQYHFTYDELTPLEQCIADVMAQQERCPKQPRRTKECKKRKLVDA